MGNRPQKFAVDVAMSGALGVDMDVRKLSANDRKALADSIAVYKARVRDVVEQGDLYRLESPYDGTRAALDYVSEDRTRAILFVYQLKSATATTVKPLGLDPNREYRVREINLPPETKSQIAIDGKTLSGAVLMRDGIVPPCNKEFDSSVIELTATN
jgi:alpha-galactosidase